MGRRRRTRGLVLVAIAALVACGGSGNDEGGDRQDYVEALAGVLSEAEGGPLTPEQQTCFAGAIVDVVGVERLADAVSPDEIRDQGITSVAELGVDVGETDGAAYVDRADRCADLRTLLVQGEVGTAEITDDATACFEQSLPDDLIREFFAAGFVQTRDELAADTELVGRVQAAFAECTQD